MWFTFISGTYYNLNNIYAGFMGAKDKTKALKCLVPYIQVYILIWAGSYSRFYDSVPLLFFAGLGLFQTYVAGLLNIASTAQIDFPYLYWEPIVYGILLYLDASRIIQSSTILMFAYIGLVLYIFSKYCLFLESMIRQLTRYLGIKLLKVRDHSKEQ